MGAERDIEKSYPVAEFVSELRHLADALESGRSFEMQIDGENVSVPVQAAFNVEYEREGVEEEIEFQIKWSSS